MAARNKAWTPQIVRDRIRTSMLINRLEKQALAELGNEKMDSLQQDAAKYLVSLVVPKAEADKNIHLSGQLTLNQLIEQTVSEG